MTTPGGFVREPGWRLFAAELGDTNLEDQGTGDRAPTYLVTPLGARVNRAYIVGVLTSNENAGEHLDSWRAQVTDPTGVFHMWAGQYQPEASKALSELTPPSVIAVVGKVRAYSPEEGVVYTSIRPEVVMPVTASERDAWILEAAKHTVVRMEAMAEALKMDPPSVEALVKLGFSERLSTGVIQALQHYGPPDLARYRAMVEDALGYLLPDLPAPELLSASTSGAAQTVQTAPKPVAPATPIPTPPKAPVVSAAAARAAAPASKPIPPKAPAAPAASEVDAEGIVAALVEQLDEGEGAAWEDIVEAAADKKLGEEAVEEALNTLLDQGRIFEPVLGRLKPA